MERDQVKTILRAMSAAYPNYHIDNLTETIDVWHMMLEDQNYNTISLALKAYIRSDTSGFAPSIGKLMEYSQKITTPQEMTASEAWMFIMRAVRNSTYNSVDEFAKLPEVCQCAVGSPEALQSMAMDSEFNESVASSNFRRSYELVLNRFREKRRMPVEIQALIEQVNQGTLLTLERERQQNRLNALEAPKETEEEKEYIAMPEHLKEKFKAIMGI